jgi:NADH-quinone oxidoreductase subunit N
MHFWLPDMYQGIWYPAAGYLSVVPKAAVFCLFFALAPGVAMSPVWIAMLVVAIATMSLGNLAALWQRNIRRLLAYSSIAHTGYLMIAVFVASRAGTAAASFYLVVYACTNLAAFALAGQFEQQGRPTFNSMRGFATTQPLTVVLFTALMAALIGLPPTGGFTAKWLLFSSAVGKPGSVILLVVAVINTALSAYYYLRAPALMVFSKEEAETPFRMPPLTLWVSIVLTLGAVVLGFAGFGEIVGVF